MSVLQRHALSVTHFRHKDGSENHLEVLLCLRDRSKLGFQYYTILSELIYTSPEVIRKAEVF